MKLIKPHFDKPHRCRGCWANLDVRKFPKTTTTRWLLAWHKSDTCNYIWYNVPKFLLNTFLTAANGDIIKK